MFHSGISTSSFYTHYTDSPKTAYHKPITEQWTSALLLGLSLLVCFVIITSPVLAQKNASSEGRTTLLFEDDWRFLKEDAPGAESPKFKDKDWQLVGLPHDWSIGEEVDRDNPTGRGGGYFPASIGWYRKTFQLPKEYTGKKVFIEFDVRFSLDGPGEIAAVDSGDRASHERFQASERRAFRGTCIDILKASESDGQLTLKANAPGLEEDTVTIHF